MKFKIDENLPSELAADLRDLGHEADSVFDERSGRRVVLAFIRERLPNLLGLDLRGRLTVVGPTRIRIR